MQDADVHAHDLRSSHWPLILGILKFGSEPAQRTRTT